MGYEDLKKKELLQSVQAAITTGWRHKQRVVSCPSGGWESKTASLADLASGERPLSGSYMAIFWLHPYIVEREQEGSLESPVIRALIHFMRAPSSCPKHLPEAPFPNSITLRVRCQCMNLSGTQPCSPLQYFNEYFLQKWCCELEVG